MQEISAAVLDGKKIAREIIAGLKKQPKPKKSLAAVLVGDNFQSKSFLKQKEKVAEELGIEFQLRQFSPEIDQVDLLKEIRNLNEDEKIGGIILQLPLPNHLNRGEIVFAIDPRKDVDALNPRNDLVLPPAVEAVRDILRITDYELRTRIAAVVGSRGFLVGAPISRWLDGRCRKLILIDQGDDLSKTKEADLIISGVGKAGLIKPEMLKSGAAVVDFGYDIEDGKIYGDFDSSSLNAKRLMPNAGFYTPTPGGTGPILVAELFRNFYQLNGFYD